jgi:hypothetical protein
MKNIKDVSTETTQIVYETTNYDAISHLNYNRDYTQERVNKVRKSINKTLKSGKKVGQREPAILTSTGKIISGQARFKACEQLAIPFKFIIDDYENDNDTLDCMLEIHHTQSTFTLSECLETYCTLQRPDYLWFRQIKKEYEIAPQTLLMIINQDWDANHSLEETFKAGKLKVKDKSRVSDFCRLMKDVDEARPFQTKSRKGATKQVFIKPMLDFVKHPEFDETLFLDQVSKFRLRLEVTIELQWDEINFIYNKGRKSKTKLPYTIKELKEEVKQNTITKFV